MVSKAVFIFALNKVMQKPVAIDGKIEIRPMMNLGLTIDHRFLDGGRCKILTKMVNNFSLCFYYHFLLKIYDAFEHPEQYLQENKKKEDKKNI